MNKNLLENLELLLKEYDKVLLANTSDPESKARWQRFLHTEAFQNCKKKILLLIPASGDAPEAERHPRLKIAEETVQELEKLYFMYEFSDRFQLFSSNGNFGEIWNYVDTGILTEEEAFQAILY